MVLMSMLSAYAKTTASKAFGATLARLKISKTKAAIATQTKKDCQSFLTSYQGVFGITKGRLGILAEIFRDYAVGVAERWAQDPKTAQAVTNWVASSKTRLFRLVAKTANVEVLNAFQCGPFAPALNKGVIYGWIVMEMMTSASNYLRDPSRKLNRIQIPTFTTYKLITAFYRDGGTTPAELGSSDAMLAAIRAAAIFAACVMCSGGLIKDGTPVCKAWTDFFGKALVEDLRKNKKWTPDFICQNVTKPGVSEFIARFQAEIGNFGALGVTGETAEWNLVRERT